MKCAPVRVGVDGNGTQAEPLRGARNSTRNLSSIGNQQGIKHRKDRRDDRVDARLHDAERSACEHHPFEVQPAHQDPHSFVDLPEHVLLGHLAVVKDELSGIRTAHAQLVQLVSGRKPLEPTFHETCRDTVLCRFRAVLRVDDQRVGLPWPQVRAKDVTRFSAIAAHQVHAAALPGTERHVKRCRETMPAGDRARGQAPSMHVGKHVS